MSSSQDNINPVATEPEEHGGDVGLTFEHPPSIEWIRDFTRRWYDAWNSHDIERVLDLMTDDIEYRDDGWPTTMHGHADVREFLTAFWEAFPDTRFVVKAGPYVIPGEPRVATHWHGTDTHRNAFHPPGIGPTDRRWEFDGVDFQEYRGGRVCKLRITGDLLAGFRQLGLLPQPGSRAERVTAWVHRVAMRVRRMLHRLA